MSPDSSEKNDLWKTPSLVRTYIEEVRGGLPFAAEQIEITLRVIEAGKKPVLRFADLGCGGGILASALLAEYPEAVGVLVDFSAAMINEACAQLSRHAAKLTFINADLREKAWFQKITPLGPFDAIVSGCAIHHFSDGRKRELYTEILDLLVPGGLFINIEHVSSSTPWVASISDQLHDDSVHAFHNAKGSTKTREEVARELVHRPDQQANLLAPVEVQCEWLRECGFQDVDCYFKVFERAVFGGRRPDV